MLVPILAAGALLADPASIGSNAIPRGAEDAALVVFHHPHDPALQDHGLEFLVFGPVARQMSRPLGALNDTQWRRLANSLDSLPLPGGSVTRFRRKWQRWRDLNFARRHYRRLCLSSHDFFLAWSSTGFREPERKQSVLEWSRRHRYYRGA